MISFALYYDLRPGFCDTILHSHASLDLRCMMVIITMYSGYKMLIMITITCIIWYHTIIIIRLYCHHHPSFLNFVDIYFPSFVLCYYNGSATTTRQYHTEYHSDIVIMICCINNTTLYMDCTTYSGSRHASRATLAVYIMYRLYK